MAKTPAETNPFRASVYEALLYQGEHPGEPVTWEQLNGKQITFSTQGGLALIEGLDPTIPEHAQLIHDYGLQNGGGGVWAGDSGTMHGEFQEESSG
jgi:hypothetical protein